MQFVDLKRQYEYLQPAIDARISAVLSHGKFILGPEVRELEQAIAKYCAVGNAVTVANGTDALQLALRAAEIGPGDAVFTSAFSFFASAEVISLVGATPLFVDIDEASYNIDPSALAAEIDSVRRKAKYQAKAIIAVDLFGLPADYAALESVAAEHDLLLIQDGAQSFGGEFRGRRVGNFGTIATTSFFPAKPLGCYGDGGAVFTNDDSLAERVESLRVHGKGTDKYDNIRIGTNSRLDTIQAAILLAKLSAFPDELVARRQIADAYSERLRNDFVVPEEPTGFNSAWALYTVRPRNGSRDGYLTKLRDKSVPYAVYYGRPLHLQPAFAQLGGCEGQCPVAELVAQSVFSLPMHPYLTSDDVNQVVSALLT